MHMRWDINIFFRIFPERFDVGKLRVDRNIRVPPTFAHPTPYQEGSLARAFIVTSILLVAPKDGDEVRQLHPLLLLPWLFSTIAVV